MAPWIDGKVTCLHDNNHGVVVGIFVGLYRPMGRQKHQFSLSMFESVHDSYHDSVVRIFVCRF